MRLFRERVTKAAAGTSDTLLFRPRPIGETYRVTRVAVEDETTTPTGRLRIGVQGHGYTHWLDEVPAPAVGRLYTFTDPIELTGDEQLAAVIVGATASDQLEMYVSGHAYHPDELAFLERLATEAVRALLASAGQG